jgi:hypothetical protein
VNAPLVRPAASISANAAEIKFFIGRWAMLALAISDTHGYVWGSAKGIEWKMYRRKSTSDNNDHITIRTMCSGETQTGTRVQ